MIITLCGEDYQNPLRKDQNLEHYFEEKSEVNVTGTISKIIKKTNSNAVYLKDVQITQKNSQIQISDFLLYISPDIELHIGNIISSDGEIMFFKPPRNPGNFDQKMYYKKQNIEGYLFVDDVSVLNPSISGIKEFLCRIRMSWSDMISSSMDEKQGNVLAAMLLGEKQSVDSELKELYQVNGIGHLLAVSGLHISLIGISLYQFFRRTTGSYPIGGAAGIIFMILYILMIGYSISASRALIMFLFRVGADIAGRRYDPPTALGFSAFVLILINPLNIYDGGFWFSFGAIISILAVLPAFTERYLSQTKKYDIKFLLMEKDRFSEEGRWKIVNQIKRIIYESVFASLSIQLFLLPVQAYFYYEISPYSIFLNLIVIPLMSFVMVSGILGSFLLFFHLSFQKVAFTFSGRILTLYLWLCEKMLDIPGARIVTGQPRFWQVVVYYIGIAGLLVVYYGVVQRKIEEERKKKNKTNSSLPEYKKSFRKKKTMDDLSDEELSKDGISIRRVKNDSEIKAFDDNDEYLHNLWRSFKNPYFRKFKYVSQIIFYIFLLCLLLNRGWDKNSFKITFLDVGQGDCIYMKSKSGLNILVDGGSSSEKFVSKYRIEPYLEYTGIGTLDYVFVTHGDADHMNGFSEMLDRRKTGIKISCLVLPPKSLWDENLEELAKKAKEVGTVVQTIQQGQKLRLEDFRLSCIYPYDGLVSEPGNETSLVLAINTKDIDILLTGDIEGQGEKDITSYLADHFNDTSWEILKVAHHGSKNTTSEEFLDVVKPRYAVISAGEDNRYGHPHRETIERLKECGSKIISTQEKGAIEVK